MSESLRRRNRLSAPQGHAVLGIAALSAVLAAIAGCKPTQNVVMDPLLTAAVGGLTAWAGATSVWWATGASAALLAVADPSSWRVVAALAIAVLMFGVGALRESAGVTRAVAALTVVQVALRLDVERPFGASAVIAGVCIAAICVSGILRRPAHVRRAARLAGLGALGFAAVAAVLLLIAGLSARQNIVDGVRSATDGLRSMRAGKPEAASDALAQSAESLGKARGMVRSPLVWPAKLVPVLGQHVHSAERLVDSARATASTVSTAVRSVDVSSVRVRYGVVDLDAISRLRLPLEVSRDAIIALDDVAQRSRSGWLVNPLGSRLNRLARETARARLQAVNAVAATDLAPSLLGANGKRRWLVLFTTPAEARGLGGFPGNWAEVVTENGHISIVKQASIVALINGGTKKDGRIVHAPEDYLARYGAYGANNGPNGTMKRLFWNNVTLSPDLPTVAGVVADLYQQSGGEPLDGVIVADPYALQGIVSLTGPLTVSSTDTLLSAGNVVDYLLVQQYQEFAGAGSERKDALGDVADQATKALLGKELPSPVEIARALGKPMSGGHLMMWSLHEEDQALLRQLNVGGAFPAAGTDGLSYTVNNAGPNKLDTYLRRSMRYDALVDEHSGKVSATVTITLRNTLQTPVTLPADIASNERDLPIGTNRTWLSIYSPLQIIGAEVDGERRDFASMNELGWWVHDTRLNLAPGQESVVVLRLAGQVEIKDVYTWTSRPQPLSTPNPVDIRIRFKHGTPTIRYQGKWESLSALTT